MKKKKSTKEMVCTPYVCRLEQVGYGQIVLERRPRSALQRVLQRTDTEVIVYSDRALRNDFQINRDIITDGFAFRYKTAWFCAFMCSELPLKKKKKRKESRVYSGKSNH